MFIRIRVIIDRFLESPGWKTFFSTVIPICSGVLSGTFVAEISGPNGFVWRSFYLTKSFWALVVLSLLMYFYNRMVYLHEREIKRFLDNDYCKAYMRSKCLPEVAEKYKQLIRDGRGGELKRAMEELVQILGLR